MGALRSISIHNYPLSPKIIATAIHANWAFKKMTPETITDEQTDFSRGLSQGRAGMATCIWDGRAMEHFTLQNSSD